MREEEGEGRKEMFGVYAYLHRSGFVQKTTSRMFSRLSAVKSALTDEAEQMGARFRCVLECLCLLRWGKPVVKEKEKKFPG